MSEQYTTLYKYVSLQFATETIEKQRLYLNDGLNFNDPFEIRVTDRKTKYVKHVDGLHILSMTNTFKNKLIWSHYTQSHKGICLTVKVPKRFVYPLCYTSARVYEDSDVDEIIRKSKIYSKRNLVKDYSELNRNKKIALIKDKKWAYEKEYRLVFDKSDESELIFENGNWYLPVKITNIYLGVNFDKNVSDIKNQILNICKKKDVSVKQMLMSNTQYAIEVEKDN